MDNLLSIIMFEGTIYSDLKAIDCVVSDDLGVERCGAATRTSAAPATRQHSLLLKDPKVTFRLSAMGIDFSSH